MWSTHWHCLIAFLDVATQWRTAIAPSGRLIWFGLDYSGVDVLLRRRQSDDQTFEDLRVMESAALGVLNGGEA